MTRFFMFIISDLKRFGRQILFLNKFQLVFCSFVNMAETNYIFSRFCIFAECCMGDIQITSGFSTVCYGVFTPVCSPSTPPTVLPPAVEHSNLIAFFAIQKAKIKYLPRYWQKAPSVRMRSSTLWHISAALRHWI